jgi:TonB family protein
MNTTQIWTNIIAYVLQVGLVVGIGAAMPAMLRISGGGRAPAARLLYWQMLLVSCLALPWMRPWHSETILLSNVPTAVLPAATQMMPVVAATPEAPSIGVIILWLLAAGAGVRLLWLAFGLSNLARYRRQGQPIPLPREWNNSAQLLVSDSVSGPVTFGLFRPVVLLPATFPSMPVTMRDAILFHELLHVERRDWLFTVGEEIVRAVFWFHPAIWWVLGEIQLAREQTVDQAVIEMTQARDPYVDTLLAMAGVSPAGVNPQMDLAPAPLFLRRRHLKKRVMGIVQEGKMSRTRIVFSQVVALTTMAVACWVVTGAIPLSAQPQLVADSSGVTVNLNGLQLLHRSPVTYPAEAMAKGIEGTVVIQVKLDAAGEVIDSAILSGPDELRKSVQQSVMNWHFDRHEGLGTRVVNVSFVKPAAPPTSGATQVAVQASPIHPDAVAVMAGGRGGLPNPQFAPPVVRPALNGPIDRIDVEGLSDSARTQLLAGFPVHVGDAFSPQTIARAREAAAQFDEHLLVTTSRSEGGPIVMRIVGPQGNVVSGTPVPGGDGAQRIGGNVMAAKLINPVKPIYPPLAKLARQQGTVRFEATIAKDGTITELNTISGPPLLQDAAKAAVSQWIYAPTLLNGAPVTVVTTIDVNFTLSEGPPPASFQ